MDDFAFIHGNWKIYHKKLSTRLAKSTEWAEFETNYEAWPLVNGVANADKVYGEIGGSYYEGASVRTYEKDIDEWTIYWVDAAYPALTEQVRGRFDENGIGTFYGEEDCNGRRVKMRFIWKNIDENNAYWDQAYQDPASGEWETNWIMEFRRKET